MPFQPGNPGYHGFGPLARLSGTTSVPLAEHVGYGARPTLLRIRPLQPCQEWTASALLAGMESYRKSVGHSAASHVGWGMVGAVLGVAGHHVVARYKLAPGTRIQSATRLADARHSWLDALSSAWTSNGNSPPTPPAPKPPASARQSRRPSRRRSTRPARSTSRRGPSEAAAPATRERPRRPAPPDTDMTHTPATTDDHTRVRLLRRGFTLEWIALGWNVIGVVLLAITALADRSIA
jgi:hypothetical protein